MLNAATLLKRFAPPFEILKPLVLPLFQEECEFLPWLLCVDLSGAKFAENQTGRIDYSLAKYALIISFTVSRSGAMC